MELPEILLLGRHMSDELVDGTVALVEVAVTTRLHSEQREERAARIDRHSRWLFPLAYLILFIAVFMG